MFVRISFRIMKRRIAWTIGKWFHEECAPATSEKVWVVLLHLLQDQGSGSDFVVRLTAAAALKECIDVGLLARYQINWLTNGGPRSRP
jgi:hypothetical protein